MVSKRRNGCDGWVGVQRTSLHVCECAESVSECSLHHTNSSCSCRCYLPCDVSGCSAGKEVSPTKTFVLWKAADANVSLCYSYENCGGVDYYNNEVAKACQDRGGWITEIATFECSCDSIPLPCKAPDSTPADSTPAVSTTTATATGTFHPVVLVSRQYL